MRTFLVAILAVSGIAHAGVPIGFDAGFVPLPFNLRPYVSSDSGLKDGDCVQFYADIDYMAGSTADAPDELTAQLRVRVIADGVTAGTPEVALAPLALLGPPTPAIAAPALLNDGSACAAERTFNATNAGGGAVDFLAADMGDAVDVNATVMDTTITIEMARPGGIFDPAADQRGALAVITVPLSTDEPGAALPFGTIAVLETQTVETVTGGTIGFPFVIGALDPQFIQGGAGGVFVSSFETTGPRTFDFSSNPLEDASGIFMNGSVVTGVLTLTEERAPNLSRRDIAGLIESYEFTVDGFTVNDENSVVIQARAGTDATGAPFDVQIDFWVEPTPMMAGDTVSGIQLNFALESPFPGGFVWRDAPCTDFFGGSCNVVEINQATDKANFDLGPGFTNQ